MNAVTTRDERLYGTEGFDLQSPEGSLGFVEEVWFSEENVPRALAVRTADGRDGLLLGRDVLAVDRENRWVVVASQPALMALDVPHLQATDDGESGTRFRASWTTTGEIFTASPPPHRVWRLPFHLPRIATNAGEPLLWQAVAVLLTSLVLIVALVVALAYVVARLVTGSPY